MNPTLLWFRQDLRLDDNPALQAAIARGGAVIPVFLHAPEEEAEWAPGGAARWWLHRSLEALQQQLAALNTQLVLRRGAALPSLRKLIEETGAGAVYWNRRYEPAVTVRDREVKRALRDSGTEAESFNGALLLEPWEIQNQSGKPFQIFTPFWRQARRQLEPPAPQPAPSSWPSPATRPRGTALDELALLPGVRWFDQIEATWKPGTVGAHRQLERFLETAWSCYDTGRNLPAIAGTSALSPHLHHGEISPRAVWHAVLASAKSRGVDAEAALGSQFITEIGWREFAHHLLYHFPRTPLEPLRAEFTKFGWASNPDLLRAWQRGRTGVPMVDAGMRQLWATGWMHNRVRMIAASFLVKNLRLPWQDGARWFWDTLVDADLAANTLGWQWSAGCGADAAPYFRIFNPVSQGRKFDPEGDYVRRWVPELAELDASVIHAPWEADAATLQAANVHLGSNYPNAMVDLKQSREAALAAYREMRA